MARRHEDWNVGLAEDLRDPEFAREFLLGAIEEEVPLPESTVEEISAPGWRRREMVLAIGLILALASTAFFAIRYWRSGVPAARTAGEAAVPWTPEIQQLWEPILSSNRPLVVCIATPLSVLIPGFGFVREFSVND